MNTMTIKEALEIVADAAIRVVNDVTAVRASASLVQAITGDDGTKEVVMNDYQDSPFDHSHSPFQDWVSGGRGGGWDF